MTDARVMGPLTFRDMNLGGPCQQHSGHTHNYDHITFVQRGKVKVFTKPALDGEESEYGTYQAGDFILIKKDVYHRIKALEEGTRYACVYAHRDADGLVAEEYGGFDNAYV